MARMHLVSMMAIGALTLFGAACSGGTERVGTQASDLAASSSTPVCPPSEHVCEEPGPGGFCQAVCSSGPCPAAPCRVCGPDEHVCENPGSDGICEAVCTSDPCLGAPCKEPAPAGSASPANEPGR